MLKAETPVKITTNISHSTFYRYLQEVNKIPSLTVEEEIFLARDYIDNNNLAAAQRLVTSHLKFVVKIALSYRHYGLPVNELLSEGNIGLIHAVKKYNPSLGFRLSTYAMWWIKASIQEYILKSWSLVKLGTTAAQKKLFFSLTKLKKKISDLYSRTINQQDYQTIALDLGVTAQEVEEMDNRMSNTDVSLNQPALHMQEKYELIDFVPDHHPNQEQLLANSQELNLKRALLTQAINSLNPREKEIIIARKLTEPAVTLDTLSQNFGISKERVRQIETQGFNKIRNFLLLGVNNPQALGINKSPSLITNN